MASKLKILREDVKIDNMPDRILNRRQGGRLEESVWDTAMNCTFQEPCSLTRFVLQWLGVCTERFSHIPQGCSTVTRTVIWLDQCQWSWVTGINGEPIFPKQNKTVCMVYEICYTAVLMAFVFVAYILDDTVVMEIRISKSMFVIRNNIQCADLQIWKYCTYC